MNCPSPALGKTIMTALSIVGATGAWPKIVLLFVTPLQMAHASGHVSPPSTSIGSVKLVYAGSWTEMTLPQALSADGGRYPQGAIEFWIKGKMHR